MSAEIPVRKLVARADLMLRPPESIYRFPGVADVQRGRRIEDQSTWTAR